MRASRRALVTLALSALCLTPIARSAHAQQPAVHGQGTVGHLVMWLGTTPSGRSLIGASIVTQSGGNIGIGVPAPMSRLAVQGLVEATLAGFKFPDGTVQTTAATTGLQSVVHDSTLTGAGTAASPLGLSLPLAINTTPHAVISIWDTDDLGGALYARGSPSNSPGNGGHAIESI